MRKTSHLFRTRRCQILRIGVASLVCFTKFKVNKAMFLDPMLTVIRHQNSHSKNTNRIPNTITYLQFEERLSYRRFHFITVRITFNVSHQEINVSLQSMFVCVCRCYVKSMFGTHEKQIQVDLSFRIIVTIPTSLYLQTFYTTDLVKKNGFVWVENKSGWFSNLFYCFDMFHVNS